MLVDPTSIRNQLAVLERKLAVSKDDPELLYNVALRYHALDEFSKGSDY